MKSHHNYVWIRHLLKSGRYSATCNFHIKTASGVRLGVCVVCVKLCVFSKQFETLVHKNKIRIPS